MLPAAATRRGALHQRFSEFKDLPLPISCEIDERVLASSAYFGQASDGGSSGSSASNWRTGAGIARLAESIVGNAVSKPA